MGKFIDKFRNTKEKGKEIVDHVENRQFKERNKINPRYRNRNDRTNSFDDFNNFDDFDDFDDGFKDDFYEANIQSAQKPESFHHFILENQYKDLERSIRGFKDVYDPKQQKWILIRKTPHCFTDSEAEDILRTAQSHLATDIKLGFISPDVIGVEMMMLYNQLSYLFRSIAEYKYGRYGDEEKQRSMKTMNLKIFLELMERVKANYSRAIKGQENKYTHESVKGQESLQQTDRFDERKRGFA